MKIAFLQTFILSYLACMEMRYTYAVLTTRKRAAYPTNALDHRRRCYTNNILATYTFCIKSEKD
jgi:hypothetical protein